MPSPTRFVRAALQQPHQDSDSTFSLSFSDVASISVSSDERQIICAVIETWDWEFHALVSVGYADGLNPSCLAFSKYSSALSVLPNILRISPWFWLCSSYSSGWSLASAKTMFLTSIIHELKSCNFEDSANSSKAGMIDYLSENRPRIYS